MLFQHTLRTLLAPQAIFLLRSLLLLLLVVVVVATVPISEPSGMLPMLVSSLLQN